MPQVSGERQLRGQLRREGDWWRLRLVIRLDNMEMLAVLATHAAQHGHSGPDLAPDELYDRVTSWLLTYGRDAVQDTLSLPEGAVGWAQRQLDRYQRWYAAEVALATTERGRRGVRPHLAPG